MNDHANSGDVPNAATPASEDAATGLREAARAMVEAWDHEPDSEEACHARNALLRALASETPPKAEVAIPAGMVAHTTSERPEDWDGGEVLMKDQPSSLSGAPEPYLYQPGNSFVWDNRLRPHVRVIAYTPKPGAPVQAEVEPAAPPKPHPFDVFGHDWDGTFPKANEAVDELRRAVDAIIGDLGSVDTDGYYTGTVHRSDVEYLERYLASLPTTEATGAGEREAFQSRVQPWLMVCFGEMIAGDREERNHRFLEEALELVQACGCTAHEAHQLVDYVYGRPIGEPHQEVGGVMVTLAALCLANGLDMHADAETELARIWTKVEAIRAKQAAKPKHSPLPVALATPRPSAPGEGMRYRHVKRGTVYEVIGEAELQMATVDLVDGSALVIYRGQDGKIWAREEGEFHDGRFATLTAGGSR
jgi:hypothetical protein